MTDPLQLLIAFVVGVLGVARAVRLITSDAYPPVEALRVWWAGRTAVHNDWRAGWYPLLTCPFCFAPYATAANLAWALIAGVPTTGLWVSGWVDAWWVVNTWAAVSYLAAMIVVRDEPPPVDPS